MTEAQERAQAIIAEAVLAEAQSKAARFLAEARERAQAMIAQAQHGQAAKGALVDAEQHFSAAMDTLLGEEEGRRLDDAGADDELRREMVIAVLDWMQQLEDLDPAPLKLGASDDLALVDAEAAVPDVVGAEAAVPDVVETRPGSQRSPEQGNHAVRDQARGTTAPEVTAAPFKLPLATGPSLDPPLSRHGESNGAPSGPRAVEEHGRHRRARAKRWTWPRVKVGVPRFYARFGERGGQRVAIALLVITVAYHYSLVTLMRTLDVDTPLAYLGLVPFIALLLVAARHASPAHEPPIHDRQLDYILGIPLLLVALAIVAFLPVRLSTLFWVWRVDLLSLPLFVAGTVAIVFGVRALWRLRLPIGFLLLAWPVPYTWFLNNWLQSFTDFTIAAVRVGVGILGVARFVPGPNGIFAIPHSAAPFQVSVASACSGVNSVVGFLLVGSAFATLVRGRRLPKLAWLFGGLVLIWSLNVIRILVILVIGKQWGEGVAIDGFHPVLGLVTFSGGILAMILVMPRFGLRMVFQRRRNEGERAPEGAAGEGGRVAVPRARLALSVVTVVAVLLAVADAGLRDYELVADDLGQPRLAAFSQATDGPQGWAGYESDSYSWAKRYFGESSSWHRYLYSSSGAAGTPAFRSSSPVVTDVISTSDLSTFSTYGLEACYNFHGYRLYTTRDVDLGGGITGKVLSYYHPKLKKDWTTVYWHWPVRSDEGKRFERVVMMMVDTDKADLASPAPKSGITRNLGIGVANRLQGIEDKRLGESLDRTSSFLVSFARDTVSRHGASPAPAPA